MGDNSNKKTDAEYEAEFQRFLEAQKSKKKNKIPGWFILAAVIAIVMVLLVILVKPWSLFENEEGESTDIYATEPYVEQQNAETVQDQMTPADMPAEPSGEGETEVPEETIAEAQEEIPSEETTVSVSDIPEMQAEETAHPPVDQVHSEATLPDPNAVTDAGNQNGSANTSAEMAVTGSIAQDDAGMLAPTDAEQIAAMVNTGNLAFSGYDFFVITNNGNDGMSNAQYAQKYYEKLVSKKQASGNGIVIFINGSDMTANICAFGRADDKLGAEGKEMLTDEFISVYRSGGSFLDAINTVYYSAEGLLSTEEETE